MARSVFFVQVNGTEISPTLAPILISMSISDTDGGKADALEIELDDSGGQIAMPPTNAPIVAGMAREDDDGALVAPPKMFSGFVQKPTSALSRGGGLVLTISAKSADLKGKPKAHKEKHHDKGKLSEVASKFGKDAGLTVKVAGAVDIEREYWAMQGESFLHWGNRIAQEVGATFKVRGTQAIFAERSAGQSIDGQSLPTIEATYGVNLIHGTLSPADDEQLWSKFRARWYDPKAAKYKVEDYESQERDGSVHHLDRHTRADQATAKRRGKANGNEADRNQGGGSITIDGDPRAQAECPCVVSGYRPAIDGTYRIKSAKHTLTRQAGYLTELELKQPSGAAGTDGRGKSGAKTT